MNNGLLYVANINNKLNYYCTVVLLSLTSKGQTLFLTTSLDYFGITLKNIIPIKFLILLLNFNELI